MKNLLKINILLLESDLKVRTHLVALLRKLGCVDVSIAKSSNDLLSQLKQNTFDLLLMDFEHTEFSNGNDFIRYLLSQSLLPHHCKVLFLSDQPEAVLADLAFRYVTTEVINKPIDQNKLLQQLKEHENSTKRLKLLFNQLSNANNEQKEAILTHAHFIGLTSAQHNEIQLIRASQLLKIGQISPALHTIKTINLSAQQASAQLAINHLIGDEKKLKLTLLKMQSLNLLARKQALYKVKVFLQHNDYYQSLVTFNQLPEVSFSAYEAQLKSIFIFEIESLPTSIEYLERKLKTTLENHHYLTIILLSMMQTVILDYCLSNHNNSLTAELCSQQIKKILKQLLNLSTADQYQDLLPFIKFVLDSIYLDQDAQKSDKTSLNKQLKPLKLRANDHLKQFFCLAAAVLLGDKVSATELFDQKVRLHGMMDISAQSMSFNYLMQKLFDKINQDEEYRASYYNQSAIDKQLLNHSFLALELFSKAHFLAPTNPVYLLNLLNTMQALKLTKFWRFEQQDLLTIAYKLKMTQPQQQRLLQLKQHAKDQC